tara:strand:+ start:181 stop:426 length:246 start_codon:yes stop_codon:yes gene_type:complete
MPPIQTVTPSQENGLVDSDNALKEPTLTSFNQLERMVLNQLQKFILDVGKPTKKVELVNKTILVLDTTMDTGKMERKTVKV